MPTTLTQTRATSLSTNSPDFVAVWLFSLLGLVLSAAALPHLLEDETFSMLFLSMG